MRVRHRVLGFLFAFSVIIYLDRVCISVAGKAIQDDLHLSDPQWGWVMGAFALAYSLFEIPVGVLGDRLGPRRVLTRIVACWSVFTALTGVVTGLWQLLVVRFLFGAGEAGAFPNAAATLSRWFPKTERARANGIVWMASRVGGALTPVLVIPVMTRFGWRTAFFVFGAAGLLWAVAWWYWFRDTPQEKRGVTTAEIEEIGSGPSRPERHALPWRRALGSSNFLWLLAMYLAHVWAAYFFITWMFLFLEKGRGFTKHDLLLFTWIPPVCGSIANILGGVASDLLLPRVGLKRARQIVGVLGHAFSGLLLVAVFFTTNKVLSVAFLALAYAGSDFALPVCWAICLDIGGRHSGAVSGAMNTAGNIGGFLATVVFGYVVQASGNFDLPLIPIFFMSFVSAVAFSRIDAGRPLFEPTTT